MVRDLVAVLEDRRRRLWKRLDGVAGDEERGADAVTVEQLEHARDTDAGAILAPREHGRRRPFVSEPDRERVEIEREADRARGHRAMLTIFVGTRPMLFKWRLWGLRGRGGGCSGSAVSSSWPSSRPGQSWHCRRGTRRRRSSARAR